MKFSLTENAQEREQSKGTEGSSSAFFQNPNTIISLLTDAQDKYQESVNDECSSYYCFLFLFRNANKMEITVIHLQQCQLYF